MRAWVALAEGQGGSRVVGAVILWAPREGGGVLRGYSQGLKEYVCECA